MNTIKVVSSALVMVVVFSGCATVSNAPQGASGPQLSHSYKFDSQTQYVQVGVELSSWGDFVAVVNPNRWKNPISPGGSLSWMNLGAWRHDWQRTGRILVGEAAIIAVGAAAAGGGGGGDSGGSSGPTPPIDGGGGENPVNPLPPTP